MLKRTHLLQIMLLVSLLMLSASCSTTPQEISSNSLNNLQKQADCPKPSKELTTPAVPPVLKDDWFTYGKDWVSWYGKELVRVQLVNKWHEDHKCYGEEIK